MQSLYKAAQSFPDKEATENRAAVSAAVRGASNPAPIERPLNYGAMTDGEFAKEKAKFGLNRIALAAAVFVVAVILFR